MMWPLATRRSRSPSFPWSKRTVPKPTQGRLDSLALPAPSRASDGEPSCSSTRARGCQAWRYRFSLANGLPSSQVVSVYSSTLGKGPTTREPAPVPVVWRAGTAAQRSLRLRLRARGTRRRSAVEHGPGPAVTRRSRPPTRPRWWRRRRGGWRFPALDPRARSVRLRTGKSSRSLGTGVATARGVLSYRTAPRRICLARKFVVRRS